LTLAITRGWLPEWYLDAALNKTAIEKDCDCICDIPSVPQEGLSLAECRYSMWETKHCIHMDPRRELAALQLAVSLQQAANTKAPANVDRGYGGRINLNQVLPLDFNPENNPVILDDHTQSSSAPSPITLQTLVNIDTPNTTFELSNERSDILKARIAVIDAWRIKVQSHIVKLLNAKGYDWLKDLEVKCKVFCCKVELLKSLQNRAPSLLAHSVSYILNLHSHENYSPSSDECKDLSLEEIRTRIKSNTDTTSAPAAYRKVLALLRAADRSGAWPVSSVARQRVIIPGTDLQSQPELRGGNDIEDNNAVVDDENAREREIRGLYRYVCIDTYIFIFMNLFIRI
jgi:hypothetical protein